MQQVIRGYSSLLQLPFIIKEKGAKQILFVIGHHVAADATFQRMLTNLDVRYRTIHPPEGVLQTTAIPDSNDADMIVAIGGGKVLDFAKGILYCQRQPLFLVAAPTTAGSGSEATPIAVFYEGKEKVSLDGDHLLPSVAILDESLLEKLPAKQRAISGADALAQSIESVWNVHSTTVSEKFAFTALEILWAELSSFVNAPEKTNAVKVLWGAHLAGKAITLTRTTGPHALSYYLTANYGIPHGQAVALTLPVFFLYNHTDSTAAQLAKIYKKLAVEGPEEAFDRCRQLFHNLGLAATLKELDLQDIQLDDWLRSVNQHRFTNNPVPFDAAKLKALFRQYL